ncbi:MAG: flagellar basal body-associated FliL family protein [Pseudomonadota bacterium]
MLSIDFARRIKIGLIVLSSFFVPVAAAAGGGEKFAEGVNYLSIKPPLIVNYGGVGKIKFIKVEISMRVENSHNAMEVAHHMPLIRDTLIMFLSGMTDEQISSGEGKELMRQQALAKINEVIAAQVSADHQAGEKKVEHAKDESAKSKRSANKPEPVSDLFFDNLVVQK